MSKAVRTKAWEAHFLTETDNSVPVPAGAGGVPMRTQAPGEANSKAAVKWTATALR